MTWSEEQKPIPLPERTTLLPWVINTASVTWGVTALSFSLLALSWKSSFKTFFSTWHLLLNFALHLPKAPKAGCRCCKLLVRNFTTKTLHNTVPDTISWISLFFPYFGSAFSCWLIKSWEQTTSCKPDSFFFQHRQILLTCFSQNTNSKRSILYPASCSHTRY